MLDVSLRFGLGFPDYFVADQLGALWAAVVVVGSAVSCAKHWHTAAHVAAMVGQKLCEDRLDRVDVSGQWGVCMSV